MRTEAGLVLRSAFLVGGLSCAFASAWMGTARAADEAVDRRFRELELRLEELEEGGSGEKGKGKGETSEKSFPPVLQVTDDITFKPGFRVQPRYRFSNGHGEDDNLFINRFRLKGGGQVYGFAKYYAELKIDGTGIKSASAAVENAWLSFNPFQDAHLRIGLYDVPFSRDALTSDSKLLFMDRSLIKDELAAVGLTDNGNGVVLHGRPFGGHLEYDVGVFQSEDFGKFPMPMARVVLNLLDPENPAGYADYRGSYVGQGRRLAIGANAAFVQNARDGMEKFDLYGWGVDLFFNLGPFTLQGEFDHLKQENSRGGPMFVDTDTHGGFVQAGYLLPLDCLSPPNWFPKVEVAGRFQDIDTDMNGVDLGGTGRKQWYSAGMNFYLIGHNLKVQTDYTFKNKGPTSDGDDLVQIQLQLDF